MASEKVKEFTNENFQAEVLNVDKPVLVDFWAEWCQPCRMLSPTIDDLADEFDGKASIGKVNTESAQQIAMEYGVMSIPTVILFKDGKPVKQFVGLRGKADFVNALNELV